MLSVVFTLTTLLLGSLALPSELLGAKLLVSRAPPAGLVVSPDYTCGASKNYYCPPDQYCCSKDGFCGTGTNYCYTSLGCQVDYSNPFNTTETCHIPKDGVDVSPDYTCGKTFAGKFGYRCPMETGRQCCSTYGYCGTGDDYCKAPNCQKDYGMCQA